jgi:hypothetical protein
VYSAGQREYAVTNKRVVMQIGLMGRMTEEVFLNKIKARVDQTVMGRMLGYGTVTIRGTGGSFEPFERVSTGTAPANPGTDWKVVRGNAADGLTGRQ